MGACETVESGGRALPSVATPGRACADDRRTGAAGREFESLARLDASAGFRVPPSRGCGPFPCHRPDAAAGWAQRSGSTAPAQNDWWAEFVDTELAGPLLRDRELGLFANRPNVGIALGHVNSAPVANHASADSASDWWADLVAMERATVVNSSQGGTSGASQDGSLDSAGLQAPPAAYGSAASSGQPPSADGNARGASARRRAVNTVAAAGARQGCSFADSMRLPINTPLIRTAPRARVLDTRELGA